MPDSAVPDPALVVLVGASAAGKSTWAQARYRRVEIVSSDELRAVVGSGRHDLNASKDAFALLDDIVSARLRRGLTTVLDTLGLDPVRRRGYLAQARSHGMSAVAVVMDVPATLARQRNARRDIPVPARALAAQLARMRDVPGEIAAEGWDLVLELAVGDAGDPTSSGDLVQTRRSPAARLHKIAPRGRYPDVVLQVSRFPWGENPAAWLSEIARAADEAGFAGIALLDHLIQIPQVGRAWDPIPEPWVTLGLLAGLDTDLLLGTLVTPVTFRPPGVLAKAAATLDVISGGRAFLGLGAGWWEREHTAYGLSFPAAPQRLDQVEAAIETIRAVWAPGTKAYDGARVALPETTCYPRPVSDVPIILGGQGRRTLRIAAQLADACNLTTDEGVLDARVAEVRRHCEQAGRDPDEVAITVLDVPVVGQDRDEVWHRVERHRGRTPAARYAATHHAGTYAEQRERYERLGQRGVRTVFVALEDLHTAADVLAAAPMLGSG